jgi:hypothetical protein
MQNKKDNFYSNSSGTNSGATSSGDEMDNLTATRVLEDSHIFSSSLPAKSNDDLNKMIQHQNTTISSSYKNNLNTLNERSLSDILGRRFITGSFLLFLIRTIYNFFCYNHFSCFKCLMIESNHLIIFLTF